LGGFPNAHHPRVLWVGIGQGSQEIIALHDAIEQPLLDLGCYRREARKFTPHLTIGRVKTGRPEASVTQALAKHASWQGGQAVVREVLVMSSELTPTGPRYAVLSRAKLADGSIQAVE
jgi:2'-5' RNA ligase